LFISSLFIPCHAAGGDHFFVRTLGDREAAGRRTILSLKDQSGHEVGCILRSIVTDLMHNALLHGEPRLGLAEIVTRLNREIQSSGFFRNGDFFTSINLALDHDTCELEFLSAGHPPVLLIRGSQVLALPAENGAGANLPLGLLGEIGFQAGRCQLQPGDKLLCYTDGLYEVPSPLGRPALTTPDFQQMVADLAAAAPEASVSELVRRVLDQIGLSGDGTGRLPQGLPDDVALLGLELEPAADVQEWLLRPQTGDELNRLIVEVYECQREEWLKRGFEQPDNRLRIVLEEALLNAWHHGNACNPQKTITLRRWYGNDATFEVTDEGAGFDPAAARDPRSFENLARPSGRGLHLIRLLSTEAQWLQGGRCLRASFARHDSPALKPKRQPVRQPMDLWQAPGWKAAPDPQ
jgi:anti-sigma regulatory factor (Ser/Thr protein kinase)